MKTSEALVQMLELFGPNGEHWCKHALERQGGSYCLVGAAFKVCPGSTRAVVNKATTDTLNTLRAVVGPGVHIFNNAETTSFEDIKSLMCACIKTELEREEVG